MSLHEPLSRGEQYAKAGAPAGRRDVITRADIMRFLRRNFLTIVIPIGLSLAAAVVYLITTTPIYTATAELLIDPKLPQAIREGSGEAAGLFDAPQLENQIAVLRSKQVAEEVVKTADLAADPELNGERPLSIWARLMGRSAPAALPEDIRARNAIAAVRSRLDLRRIGTSYAIEVSFPSYSPEKSARIVNATTAAYLNDLIEARASAARQGSVWLEERVEQLRSQMNEAARRVQQFRASHDYRILKRTDGPLGGDPPKPRDEAPEAATTTLEELESTAATYRKIYENFYQAFTEAVQRESYPVSNARVISTAIPPSSKSHPKTFLTLALAGLLGSIAGVAFALIRNTVDRPITDARTVRNELGLGCLGQIPKLGLGGGASLRASLSRAYAELVGPQDPAKKRTGFGNRLKRAAKKLGEPPHSIAGSYMLRHSVDVPMTAFSRAIRRVKTGLSLEAKSRQIRLIGVTSAHAGEGKTTIAANLAAQYASPASKVLLVDADFYRATLTRQLDADAGEGLMDILYGGKTLEDVTVHLDQSGLDLLPMVRKPEMESKLPDVLASEAMRAFIASISDQYAIVFFDLPPLKIAADAYELATQLDGLILIAESDVTPLSAIEDAIITLREARAPVLGLVINKLSTSTFTDPGRETANYY